jgi:hypothetical protein
LRHDLLQFLMSKHRKILSRVKGFFATRTVGLCLGCCTVAASQAHAEVSDARLRIGVIVGSIAGFGIGHIVQGRFNEGALATITQTSSIAMLALGLSDCDEGLGRLAHPGFSGSGGCKLMTLSSLIFAASRTLEVFDLLEHMPVVDLRGTTQEPELETLIVPTARGVSVGLNARF